jgi:hypothetical protein
MARIEQDQIDRISVWYGMLTKITHVTVYFTPDVNLEDLEEKISVFDRQSVCSCSFDKLEDEDNVPNS